jgi:glyoxylase-like metal-dependent hydrolase (beta-lactamase superfamily II)
VDRRLHEGDEIAGFAVLDVPGHSAGHVAFWREADGVLVLGDVLSNMDQVLLLPGLREPKPYLTPDPVENRRSAKKLAALEPRLVLFGHGAPVRDPRKFVDFVDALPD